MIRFILILLIATPISGCYNAEKTNTASGLLNSALNNPSNRRGDFQEFISKLSDTDLIVRPDNAFNYVVEEVNFEGGSIRDLGVLTVCIEDKEIIFSGSNEYNFSEFEKLTNAYINEKLVENNQIGDLVCQILINKNAKSLSYEDLTQLIKKFWKIARKEKVQIIAISVGVIDSCFKIPPVKPIRRNDEKSNSQSQSKND